MGTTVEPVVVEMMQSADLEEAAAVLSRAFAYRPVHGALSADRRLEKERRLNAIHRVILGRLPGQTLVARKGRRIVGAMRLVKWPQCQVSPRQGLAMLPLMLGIQRGASLRWLMARYVWWRHDPRRPHLHIDPLGVETDLQGRGIGSQLLLRFCELADEASLAGYLETDTPENIRLYQRFGFLVTGRASIMGCTDWFMWRDAKENLSAQVG
jgi:ribosomal protein S18 acetylase RimI-like enzyme